MSPRTPDHFRGKWDEVISDMVRAHASNQAIMEATGMSRAGLTAAVKRLGLAGVRLKARSEKARNVEKTIVQLREEGLTVKQIAERLGMNFQHVSSLASSLGVGAGKLHGEPGMWASGCDCDICTAAKTEYKSSAVRAARKRFRETGHVPSHGVHGYTVGCRCALCRTAHESRPSRVELAQAQEVSLEVAHRRGEMYTSREIDMILSGEYTDVELAAILERTVIGVQARRELLQRQQEAKDELLASLDTGE